MARAVAEAWHCQRSGDCCRSSPVITMTHAERRELEAVAASMGWRSRLQWRAHDRPSFTMLVGRPCPFLATDSEGHATCGAYAARPYNCRRFGCYRPDPSTEAYDAGGPLGCRNLSDRLDTSPAVVEAYRQAQTHAAEWAAAHGWQED